MMPRANAEQLIADYYRAFNAGDMDTFLGLLTDDVQHDINQGERETGREAFGAFMDRMNRNYREQLVDIQIMSSADGSRAAAEFVVLGEYLVTDEGLPEARGQRYRLPAGAFFELRDNKVARISNYYNLNDWIAQVGA
ncbi:ketosteroid isomerase-related protein [uncultured Oceanisphaera sp.]|uniref:ketosteroid isomerase-related protein n=1 Tax=uncultured Oceanisphaera sp. TaxID=353858 RepID=UPI002624A6D3|nr:ketosteroid isomerase-related protein [uncultured Oceanisphaera sp.]